MTPAPASETRYYLSAFCGLYWSKRDGQMFLHKPSAPDGLVAEEPVEDFPDWSHPEIDAEQVAAIRAAWKEGR